MKRLPILLCLSALIAIVSSCKLDPEEDAWEYYEDWRNENLTWLQQQAARTNSDGSPYYKTVVPDWDAGAYVLIHYFNDRNATADNLSPLYTSTVDVKYKGQLYNDEAFDSSFTQTAYGDSIYRTKLSDVVSGWAIALMDMHVGDSCEVLIPYQQGYGSTGSGSIMTGLTIPPYSALKFHIKLVDIPGYEKPAK